MNETADLETRLRTGDEEALAALFERHKDRLWRIVHFRMAQILRQRLEPDDILQEAYLAASKRIKHFAKDGFESSFLWLRLIVTQTMIEAHRRHLGAQARDLRREIVIESVVYPQATSVSLAFCLVGSDTSPSQRASRQELFDRVAKTIATMEPLDQEVLALRHFEELTNKETAEVLGIEPKAASIRYVRALQRLRSILAEIPGFLDDDGHAG